MIINIFENVEYMQGNRLLTLTIHYKSADKRNRGRFRKRKSDQVWDEIYGIGFRNLKPS